MQNYLVFQKVCKKFKKLLILIKLQCGWESEGLSDESIKLQPTSDNSLNSGMNYIDNAKIRVKTAGSC